MAKISFNKKELEKQLKSQITDKLKEKLSLFGTPVESITKDDVELEISANRADLFALTTFARAFKSFLGEKKQAITYPISKHNFVVKVDKSVKSVRPYIAAAVIKDLDLDDAKLKEIISLQEKLHNTVCRKRDKCAIGIYPLDKISFPITYKAENADKIKFIPLGMEKEMNAHTILQKHPTGKEHAELLRNEQRYPIIIDSKNQILSMPPIINSETIGRVHTNTKNIFIECTGKNQEIVSKILSILTAMFAEMDGKIYSCQISDDKKYDTPNLELQKAKLDSKEVENILGIKLSDKQIKELLEKMGHEYSPSTGIVKSPAWRSDILHPIDLIEDIAIAYGYDKIIPEIPKISTTAEESKKSVIQNKIMNLLVGLGFLETSSLHLIKQEEINKHHKQIEVENARTEYKILRSDLSTPILRTLSENTNTSYPQKIAEIGTVFHNGEDASEIAEQDNLALAIVPGNVTEAKRILDYITSHFGIEYEIQDHTIDGFIEGRAGKIIIGDKSYGHIGELHPSTLNAHNLKLATSIIEIDLAAFYHKLGLQ